MLLTASEAVSEISSPAVRCFDGQAAYRRFAACLAGLMFLKARGRIDLFRGSLGIFTRAYRYSSWEGASILVRCLLLRCPAGHSWPCEVAIQGA
ncbi:hypothetical protein SAMN02745866_00391 [Alteromonadaceae bacterium Bs31]|nr:hypothetical protein SAMN02745866_00391 [Alteromonadaceae bacterium Bs31]